MINPTAPLFKHIRNLVLSLLMLSGLASTANPTDAPKLEFVMTLDVTIGETIDIGETLGGHRVAIPITGGTIDGPAIKGVILPGGADYQKIDTLNRRTELEAIYNIRTEDGYNIHVRNRGLLLSRPKDYYFYTSPTFEAPADSPYAWLNDAIYVCRPASFNDGGIVLNIWRVCD